jgi:hypothetical protein
MKIIRKTQVKQVLTEQSKDKLQRHFQNQYVQLENECNQLQFEKRKLQAKKKFSPNEVNKRFQVEIERRQNKMKWVEYQLEQLEILPLGSEIVEREVDEIIDIQIGNHWNEVMGDTRSIIIQDGVVIRIDE